MAQVVWNGKANWTVPIYWNTGAPPKPADDVVVQSGIVTLSTTVGSFSSVTVDAGSNTTTDLKISNNGVLTTSSFDNMGEVEIAQVSGSTSASHPSLIVNGLLTNHGFLFIGNNDPYASVPTVTVEQLDNEDGINLVGNASSRPVLTVTGTAILNGLIMVAGSTANFQGAVSGTGVLYLGGVTDSFLNLASPWSGGKIVVGSRTIISRVTLASGTDPGAMLNDFAGLSSVDFSAVTYAAGDYVTLQKIPLVAGQYYTPAGTVSVRNSAGNVVASMKIGNPPNPQTGYVASGFAVSDDGTGHLLLSAALGHSQTIDDFNGDGRSDLLWRNPTSGVLSDWSIPNGVTQSSYTIGAPGSGYAYIRVGDFNGDGTADLLLRNATNGVLLDWDMSNGVRSGAHAITTLSADWTVKGAADFNGDGTSDLLLYNTQTGSIKDLIIRGDKIVGSNALGAETPGNGWGIIGTGDFNGDGMGDVLLRNSTTGALQDWEVVDGKRNYVQSVGTQPTDTTIVGIGDFNGNGVDDLLLQTSSRELESWAMKDGHGSGKPVDLGIAVPSGFNVVSPGTFGTSTDVMIYNPKTGQVDVGLNSRTHIASWTVVGSQSPTNATLLV